MSLSAGQITDAFKSAVGRVPTGSELAQYSSDNSLEGSPGQQTLIGKLKGSGNFSSAGDASNYVNGLQDNIYNNGGPGVQSAADILNGLRESGQLPNTEAPKAPSLVQQYQDLAEKNGVAKLQADINDLKAQQDDLAAQTRVNVSAERGKPVATNVIEGRVGVQTQQAQEQYDFLSRQLSRKTDDLGAAIGNIKTIMDLTQTDYNNAVQSYTTQFNQAISTINLVQGIQQSQKDDIQKARDNARANLQIFANTITAGNLSYNDLPADQKANINKMEVQAGLPIGFTAALKEKLDPKANIISTSENQGQIQVLVKNPDGSISLQTYGTKNAGGGTQAKPGSTEYIAANKSVISQGLNQVAGSGNNQGHVPPQVWQSAKSAFTNDGLGTVSDFNTAYAAYTDPNRGDFQDAYGFSLSTRKKLTGQK